MNQDFYNALKDVLTEDKVLADAPMKNHTTFSVGGAADYYTVPESKEEVRDIIRLCRQWDVPFYIIGNGSNLLVSDKGYRGVMIQIYRDMSEITVEGHTVRAQAGALLSSIAARALSAGLTGFEFAAGIPGTLGGACVMNAGAYGGEMKDVLRYVTVLTEDGAFLTLHRDELELGYRTSVIARKGYIALEAEIELKEGSKDEIKARMDELKEKRVTRQPLEYPSAGSTF